MDFEYSSLGIVVLLVMFILNKLWTVKGSKDSELLEAIKSLKDACKELGNSSAEQHKITLRYMKDLEKKAEDRDEMLLKRLEVGSHEAVLEIKESLRERGPDDRRGK